MCSNALAHTLLIFFRRMPPAPNDCNISGLVVKQPKVTQTVTRVQGSVIEVSSEFGRAFPPVPCTVRIIIIDNSIGAIGVFNSSEQFVAPSDDVHVSTFAIPPFASAAPFTGSQDVCTVYATLLPASNPPNAPDASFLTTDFMIIS
jgi:hypothetical protein